MSFKCQHCGTAHEGQPTQTVVETRQKHYPARFLVDGKVVGVESAIEILAPTNDDVNYFLKRAVKLARKNHKDIDVERAGEAIFESLLNKHLEAACISYKGDGVEIVKELSLCPTCAVAYKNGVEIVRGDAKTLAIQPIEQPVLVS